MTNLKKRILRVTALCLAVCLLMSMAACSGTKTPADDTTARSTVYTIMVEAEGGKPLSQVGVYIYTDDAKTDLVWFDKTDDNGTITFDQGELLPEGSVAILSDVPENYLVEQSYPITGEATRITLKATLLEEGDLSAITYQLGDTVHDFTVTTPDGTEYTLSKLLKEKDAVVLNFWFNNCGPCKSEFPYLEEAYKAYSDVIAVVGMNPVDQETEDIADFQEEMETTFPMAAVDPLWANAMQIVGYPTTVVIDRFGTICLIHMGAFTDVETVKDVFAYFTAVDYEPTVFKSVEEVPHTEEEEDLTGYSADDPIEIGGMTAIEVTVKAGKTRYYNLYKVDQMYMQYWSENVTATYSGYTYEPSGGTVGFSLYTEDTYTPAKVSFTNTGKKDETFTLYLSPHIGTVNNPYSVGIGEFYTTVYAGNDQGVYHIYQAEESGTLTVKCISVTAGINYGYSLYNLDTYAYRTLEEDGKYSEDGYPSVSIQVNAGDDVQIIVSTLPDSSNTYPGGNFQSSLSFGETSEDEEKEKVEYLNYAVTVTDENRAPMAGVYLNIKTDDSTVVLETNESGVATTKLPAGTYQAKVLLPEGYTSAATSYILSKTVPMASVRLEKIVTVMKDYTVKVVDENGGAMANVVVAVGDKFGFTDSNGTVKFNLLQGEYAAVVSAPAGYTAESQYAFAADATELTIQLKKSTGSSTESAGDTTYTVTAAKYDGTPITDAVVKFLQNGTQKAMQMVDANGKASVKLPSGSYTVELAFSGDGMYYEEKDAVVTASAPELTISVTGAVPAATGDKLYNGSPEYTVDVGGTYVTMQADVVNYFLFTPTQSGTYQFTTSDPSAVISYQGSTSYIFDATSSTDYNAATNTFTRNVKESNLGGTHVIGITGAADCILEITRIGDAVLDETDMEAEEYVPAVSPVQQTLTVSGTMTYVDLTSTASVVKGTDGYYHLNSADGPIVYVNLGKDARYISFYNMLGFTGFGGTSFSKVFHDENGTAVKKEDYTKCMMEYVEAIDSKTGLYPLNDDLIYMLQNGGEYKGWWDSENGNYLFEDLPDLNTAIAWMFACCYYQ